MIVLSDAQGNIQNITPARVYQGSNDANDFNLIAPFANSNIITIGFLLPNTIDGVPTQFAQMEQPKTLNDELNTWTYKLPIAVTQYYGTVRYQFKVTNQSGIIIATGSGTFEVIRGVDVDLPAEPTTDVYMQILTALSQVYADFTNKVDITYTDVQNAIEQKILNNANNLVLQRTHGEITNNITFDDDGVKLNGHLIAALDDITDYTYSKQEINDKDNLVLSIANSHSDNNLEIAKNYTDNELLNYYTKAEVDNKDESVLNSAKNYTYSKEEIDAKDTALSVKIEAVEDKSDGRLKALSFEDNDQIIAWIDGTYTYVDGVTGQTITPSDVTIGQNIYNKNLVQNDYWVSRLPITSIDDLAILVTDKNTLNATDIKFNPANENKLSAVNVQGAIDEITTTYATKIDIENKIENKIENNSVLFTITTDKWQDLADKEPYKFSAMMECDYSITTTGETIYELINDNVVNFANYGFALNEVSLETTPKSFTFYAMEKPTASVNLRVLITANSVEVIAPEGGAV